MGGIHQIDDGHGCIVERPDIEPIGAQHDDIGLLAGGERPDFAVEIGAACTIDSGEFEHIPAGE